MNRIRAPLMSRLRRQLRGTANRWMPPTSAAPEPPSTWLAAKQRRPAGPALHAAWMHADGREAEHGPAGSWLMRRKTKQRRSA